MSVTGFGGLQDVLAFVRSHSVAVISTTSPSGLAQGAVIEFGCSEDLELIFDTFRSSRKYGNLQQDNRASFVIGWDYDITLQYEGVTTELQSTELARYQSVYFEQVPQAADFAGNPDIAYFRVSPSWIRMTDLNMTPWQTFEHNFH